MMTLVFSNWRVCCRKEIAHWMEKDNKVHKVFPNDCHLILNQFQMRDLTPEIGTARGIVSTWRTLGPQADFTYANSYYRTRFQSSPSEKGVQIPKQWLSRCCFALCVLMGTECTRSHQGLLYWSHLKFNFSARITPELTLYKASLCAGSWKYLGFFRLIF